jgi:hypothetical protein
MKRASSHAGLSRRSVGMHPWLCALLLAVGSVGCTDLGDSSAVPDQDGAQSEDALLGDDGSASDGTVTSSDDGSVAGEASSEVPADGGSNSDAPSTTTGGSDGGPSGMDSTVASYDATGIDVTVTVDTGPDVGASPDVVAESLGTIDAGPDAAMDVAESTEAASSEASADSSFVDSAPDSGSLVPCTTAAQTDCVQCQGSTGNLCSATEAVFVQLDINSGAAVAPGPSPDTGCYECLVGAQCIDVPQEQVKNKECDDLSGNFTDFAGDSALATTLCLATLECEVGPTGNHCASSSDGISYCYCGSGGGPSTACLGMGSAVNGACIAPIVAGYPYKATDAADILSNWTTKADPSGRANEMLNCGAVNSCSQCLP